MKEITLEELLEAGCHFGHQVTRSNPKARDFVFEARDNIQIIDLAKTKEGLDEAAGFVRALGERGGTLLVVGTKRQAKQIVDDEVARVRELLESAGKDSSSKLFYITQRWIGGVLTNFSEVSRNFKKLQDLKDKLADPEEKAKYTKKEIGQWEKEKQRLESFYQGIIEMKEKPDALFIIDSHLEDLAVREALSTNVETLAIVDTNADPYVIDHPIPANDDAAGSIKLIVSYILDAWAEGAKAQKPPKIETEGKPGESKTPLRQGSAEQAKTAAGVEAPKEKAKKEVKVKAKAKSKKK